MLVFNVYFLNSDGSACLVSSFSDLDAATASIGQAGAGDYRIESSDGINCVILQLITVP